MAFADTFIGMVEDHKRQIKKRMPRKLKQPPCYWGVIAKDGYVEILSMTRAFARGHMQSGERLCRFRVQLDQIGQRPRKRR